MCRINPKYLIFYQAKNHSAISFTPNQWKKSKLSKSKKMVSATKTKGAKEAAETKKKLTQSQEEPEQLEKKEEKKKGKKKSTDVSDNEDEEKKTVVRRNPWDFSSSIRKLHTGLFGKEHQLSKDATKRMVQVVTEILSTIGEDIESMSTAANVKTIRSDHVFKEASTLLSGYMTKEDVATCIEFAKKKYNSYARIAGVEKEKKLKEKREKAKKKEMDISEGPKSKVK